MDACDGIFVVDGGASKTACAWMRPDGHVLARHQAGPCNLWQDSRGAVAAILAGWEGCGGSERLAGGTCLSAGLAGLSGPGLPEFVRTAFAGFRQVLLSGDGYAALVGCVGAEPGALIAVGTGSVGCRFDAHGAYAQRGGWGFPAGDRGGGAWIGLQAVTRWLEARDGLRPAMPALGAALEACLGCDRRAILAWLRGASPARFASLAPLVLEAAGRDEAAAGLLHEAAAHLRVLARGLCDGGSVALAGGLAAPLLPTLAALEGGFDFRLAAADAALQGAFAIAQGVRPPEYPQPLYAGGMG